MTGRRNHRSRAASFVLSLAWLPYLIVQCPNCPGATTSLVRCGGPRAEAPHSARHANEGSKPRCHGDTGQSEHRHGPAADCCSFGENRATTHDEIVSVTPPDTVSAPWRLPEIAPIRPVSSSHSESIEQQTHSPPLFLVFCSLLL